MKAPRFATALRSAVLARRIDSIRVAQEHTGEHCDDHKPDIDSYLGLCTSCGGELGDHARPAHGPFG